MLHYLDDFHTLEPPNSPICQSNIDTCVHLFEERGIPLHPEKLQGSFYLYDSTLDWAAFPRSSDPSSMRNFDHIAALLETWSTKDCTHKELESLIGNLQYACKVIPQGCNFFQCMINLLSAFWHDDHPIRLNQKFCLDLSLWREFFLPCFNLCSWLAGLWCNLYSWMAHRGIVCCSTAIINCRQRNFPCGYCSFLVEPLMALKACQVLFRQYACGQHFAFHCLDTMVLLRHLSLMAACYSFVFTASHRPGKENSTADALSHFDFQGFINI